MNQKLPDQNKTDGIKGELHGPKAADYRPFNPVFFATHEGFPKDHPSLAKTHPVYITNYELNHPPFIFTDKGQKLVSLEWPAGHVPGTSVVKLIVYAPYPVSEVQTRYIDRADIKKGLCPEESAEQLLPHWRITRPIMRRLRWRNFMSRLTSLFQWYETRSRKQQYKAKFN